MIPGLARKLFSKSDNYFSGNEIILPLSITKNNADLALG